MKTNLVFTFILFLLMLSIKAQYSNHATIDSVKVTYLAIEHSTLSFQNGEIAAIPQATISLKTGSVTISKIYFKIRNEANDSLLYQVDYTLTNSPQTSNTGFVLFNNENNVTLLISPGEPYALKPYTYEVITEDSSQNQQSVFSVIQ